MHGLSSRRPRRDCWPTRIKSLVSTQHGRSDKDWIALPVFLTGTMSIANGLTLRLLVSPQLRGWSPSLRVIEGDSIHLLPLFLRVDSSVLGRYGSQHPMGLAATLDLVASNHPSSYSAATRPMPPRG